MHSRAIGRSAVSSLFRPIRASASLLFAAAFPLAQADGQARTDTSLFQRGQLTGDWGGLRAGWKKKGFDVASSVTQFYQGVASGGIETGQEYNGIADAELKLDFEKLAGWRRWSADFKTQVRFGGPVLGGIGSISPVNTAGLVPANDGTEIAVTALNFTTLILVDLKKRDLVALSFGRYDFLDIIDEHFFAGGGVERFMNIAQIGPLTVAREVPLVTNALSLTYVRHGEPFATLAIIDPNDHSLDAGLTTLFADGVSFAPTINLPAKWFGRTAKHTIAGAITTKAYSPFDALRQALLEAVIPGPPVTEPPRERGSWSAAYTFRQFIVERAKSDGWGFFTQVSFANTSTSPITTFFDLGLGGNGLFTARRADEFGIAYAYTDLSSSLKDNVGSLPIGGRLRVEHQVELFYNVHFAPWLQLSGDLQVVRPNRPAADTATIPGARLRVVF